MKANIRGEYTQTKRLNKYFIFLMIIWSLIILISLITDLLNLDKKTQEILRTDALSSYNKDIVYRRWNSIHGGVYVPITDSTSPNPYLSHIKDRDIESSTGQKLTLINPAYMTRQVHEIGFIQYGYRGHITSLKPIRPENAPDDWEKNVLLQFQKGASEAISEEIMNGKKFFRFMRPMITEDHCMKCHEIQGYKVGEIRGGISVSIDMAPYIDILNNDIKNHLVMHTIFWLFGLFGIYFGIWHFKNRIKNTETAQKKLLQNESMYRNILDNMGEGFALMDMKYTFLFTNPAAGIIFGSKPEELVGKQLKDYISPEEFNRILEKSSEPDNTEKNIYEINIFIDNEIKKDILITSTPRKNDSDEYIGTFCIFRDITERKNIELALRHSEEKFFKAFQSTPDAIIITRQENGKIIEVNKMFFILSGYTRKETINKTTTELNLWVNANDRIFVIKQVKEKGRIFEQEIRFRIKSGKTRDCTLSIEQLKIGAEPCFLSIIRDITERKIAENTLKQSELKFRELFDFAPVGYHELNTEGKVIQINRTEMEMLGYTENEMINHYAWEFAVNHEMSMQKTKEKLSGTGISNKPFERLFLRKDGTSIPVLVEDLILRNSDGNITGIRSTIQDISEQKKNEIALHESNIHLEEALTELRETQRQVLQQERLRALGQMASGIAHDINNSLTPILGYVDILLDDEEIKKRANKELSKINTASKDIKRTIQRMKEFYRPKTDDDEIHTLNINNIIQSTLDLTRHKWKDLPQSHGAVIDINLQYEPGIPSIYGNESELREAMTNLIINAADAMPNGGELTIKTFSSSSDKIAIEIIDSGIGMNEETQKRCLEPFYSTKGDKGTGLGLSMVYGIIQRLDGIIEIESKPDKGTTFRIIIPKKTKDQIIGESIRDIIEIPSLKILIIDDESEVRELLERMLMKMKHNIISAESGETGINRFKEAISAGKPIDLIITDLGMDYMDGKTLSRLIKDISPKTPIVMLTGWGSFIEKENYAEVDYILSKPITKNDLTQAISDCFNKLIKK